MIKHAMTWCNLNRPVHKRGSVMECVRCCAAFDLPAKPWTLCVVTRSQAPLAKSRIRRLASYSEFIFPVNVRLL
jgi:hypothetical protein